MFPELTMKRWRQRDEWMQDLEQRQRNLVFPDTVQNSRRFWSGFLAPQSAGKKVFTVVLAVYVLGGLLTMLLSPLGDGSGRVPLSWRLEYLWHYWVAITILGLLIFGPVFGFIAWGTRRALRQKEGLKKKHPHERTR